MTETDSWNEYVSPFSTRYSSREMSRLFSVRHRICTFRKLWVALARAEHQLGLPITEAQIHEMEANVEKIDFHRAAVYEKALRHDVMAHIHAFGDQCPNAKPIIHLGATSSYVADNSDLIQLKEALRLLLHKLISVVRSFAGLAERWAALPCLSYTHLQSAQPSTIGKRIALWLQDLIWDVREWERLIEEIPFLGVKGATGTQASFLSLFDGDEARVVCLEKEVAAAFGFAKVWSVSGQTYPRKLDLIVLNALQSFAASAHKIATDLRLLSQFQELSEPFATAQVGSSAMPYKRNPIYSERICGLARFVISLAQNPAYTAATQWLERTLDDSANRRLSIPESFLGVDAILNLFAYMIPELTVHVPMIEKRLEKELPFLVMENILMQSVKKGGSRQRLHETLRHMALAAGAHAEPLQFLLEQITRDDAFQLTREEILPLLQPQQLIGRAPSQVREFLVHEVFPLLERYAESVVTFPAIEQ